MEYGLIGEKLSHSFSKEIHESFGKYSYELHEIDKNNLPEFLKKREFKGINVTMPYKETVIPYLDRVSGEAKEIGAVNTIVNRNGVLTGYNTDAYGLEALIKMNFDIKNKKVLILGSGGTSKTALYVARKLGAKYVYRVSRNKCDKKDVISYDEAYSEHTDADVIINTTPVGMYPENEGIPVDISAFPRLSAVFDVIFNPIRTNLCLEAQEKGIVAANGLFMLVAQAVMASKLFEGANEKLEILQNNTCGEIIGSEINKSEKNKSKITESAMTMSGITGDFDVGDVNALNRIAMETFQKILLGKLNLVLIGMPTCGKTSVGQEVSRLLVKHFFDTDAEIENYTGMSSADFIHKFGEKEFRLKEKEVIEKISKGNNYVIATGGGSVLDPENVRALKRNGVLIFIDRDLEYLSPMPDRPLGDTYEKLEALYNERYPVYKAAADITIDGNHGIKENAEEIISKVNRSPEFSPVRFGEKKKF